jgi:Fur family ferric uptake transcriptional regulator
MTPAQSALRGNCDKKRAFMHLPISVKNCRYDKAMSTSEQLAADLKNTGLKVTIPRIKVLTIFEQSKTRHLSAEDVYKQMLLEDLDVGLATVYRVLTQFEQAGILRRSNFEAGKAVFELDQGSHHDHLVCIDCGRVEEFFDPRIEERQRKIAEAHGFELQDHSLALYGQCQRKACPHRRSKAA